MKIIRKNNKKKQIIPIQKNVRLNNNNEDISIEISTEIKQKYFTNPPYFNFLYAEEELGINFLEFSKNQFHDFLKCVFVEDFINIRKCYIQRNLIKLRFHAHKLKSPLG